MDKKTSDRLFVIMFIALFVFMILTTYLIIHYSEELKANPLIYGAKRFGNIECSCTQYKSDGNPNSYFAFNSTKMWDLKTTMLINPNEFK